MKRYHVLCQWFVVLIMGISLQACSSTPQATQGTQTSTLTPSPTTIATSTLNPTKTPRPTITPNFALTQNYDDIFSEVQKFKDDGLIPSTSGKYRVLSNFTRTIAERGWLNYEYLNFQAEQFIYKAHVHWSTSGKAYDASGCGIIFALQPKGNSHNYYGVVLDQSRIYFTITNSGYYYNVETTRGTGKLDFGNPADADLTLLVYDYKAYVYVDNEFIGEYTLSKSRPLSGKFGYGVISGTNHDYGTLCEITNSRMWNLDE